MANTVDKVLKIAEAEKGYMEKSKTAYKKDSSIVYKKESGHGSDNITKYWEELKKDWQGQPWCLCWINWIFKEAYGEKQAKKLLCVPSDWTYYTPTAANYFKNKGQWKTSNPKVGDVIFFKNSTRICHVGLVVKVTSSYVYTIEGNTSGDAGVVANGGMVYGNKKYALNYSRIAGYGSVAYDAESTTISSTTSTKTTTTASTKKTYSGTFPTLPDRGYYKLGDGYKTLTNYTTQIKRVQKLLNWIMDASIAVDGDYGEKSVELCKKFQKKYGLTVDGEFGSASLKKAKTIEK